MLDEMAESPHIALQVLRVFVVHSLNLPIHRVGVKERTREEGEEEFHGLEECAVVDVKIEGSRLVVGECIRRTVVSVEVLVVRVLFRKFLRSHEEQVLHFTQHDFRTSTK